MENHSVDQLGRLQREVIEAVWDLGEATVHAVRDRLSAQRDLAYTTILTAMQKLEKTGWLTHRSQGKTYVYVPARTREQAHAGSAKSFVGRVFGGRALSMFQHLIDQEGLSDKDLTELQKMIEKKRKERRYGHSTHCAQQR